MLDTNATQTTKPQVTITLPSWILAIGKVIDYGAKTAMDAGEAVGEGIQDAKETMKKNPLRKFNMPKFNSFLPNFKNFSYKRKLPLLLVVTFIAIGVVAWRLADRNTGFVQGAGQQTSANREVVEINKSFEIPIKTQEGEDTGERLKVTIKTMEKVKEILIQNNQARAKDGKTFLLITMDIENPTKRRLTVKPIDMVRLISSDGKSLAADVHNNEIASEPVSLKSTRIGYVVDESQNNFQFLIGEVRGSQEPIEVAF